MYQRKCGTLLRLTWKNTISSASVRDRRGESSQHSQKLRGSILAERQAWCNRTILHWLPEKEGFHISDRKVCFLFCWRQLNRGEESHHFIPWKECQLWLEPNSPVGSNCVNRVDLSYVHALFSFVRPPCIINGYARGAFHCVFVCGWWICVS